MRHRRQFAPIFRTGKFVGIVRPQLRCRTLDSAPAETRVSRPFERRFSRMRLKRHFRANASALARQSGWEPILIVALDPAVRHPIEAHRARRRTSCLSPGRGVFHRATNPHLLPDKPWGATSKSLIGLNPSLSLNQRVPGSSPGRPPSKLSIAAGALYHHGIIIHGPCL